MHIPQFDFGRKETNGTTAVIRLITEDRPGISQRVVNFVTDHGGNIAHDEGHHDRSSGTYSLRIEWELTNFHLKRSEIGEAFKPIGELLGGPWSINFSDEQHKLAVFVTREPHCLVDILRRCEYGDISNARVAVIIGNDESLIKEAFRWNVPFHLLNIVKDVTKEEWQEKALSACKLFGANLLVFAKFMQIVSSGFLEKAPPVINVHHALSPAFPGGNVYARAFTRGVKKVGATAHYVTEAVDDGPIISQESASVSHRQCQKGIRRIGQNLETFVLSEAVYLHTQHRVIVYNDRCVVFD